MTLAQLALSAIVSTSAIFQSAIRLSMTSSAGTTCAVAASTSSGVTPGPESGAPRTKAISGSMRGAMSADASIVVPVRCTRSP
jgi:hypothetical protein